MRPCHDGICFRSPLWTGATDELVNCPQRGAGESWYGKTDFFYDGDSDAIHRVISRYAKLDGTHIYVTTDGDNHRAVLQIQHHGDQHKYLTIHVHNATELSEMNLPVQIPVEALPSIGEPIDPEKLAAQRSLWDAVQKRVQLHNEQRSKAK